MKQYNLTRASLYQRRGDKNCYCALGVYAEEKMGAGVAARQNYDEFRAPRYSDDLSRMATFLAPLIGSEWRPEQMEHFEVIYRANDRSAKHPDDDGRYASVVPVEKIKEALALVGVDVELTDLRVGEDVDND